MIRSRTDRRIHAALEFVDAYTRSPVREPLQVTCDDATLHRQRSGRYLVVALGPRLPAALRAHADHFESVPATPAPGTETIDVRVVDASRRYRSHAFALPLPRNGDPLAADSVLRAQVIALWPTAAAPMLPNWTTVHASAFGADGRTPLAGARVALDTGEAVVHNLTDATGQATLALIGQPIFSLDGSGNLRRTLPVTLRLQHDADPAHALADTEAELARLSAQAPLRELSLQLATGEASSVTLTAP